MTATLGGRVLAGREIRIRYRNWRGELSLRRIVPDHIWFGATEWHPEHQWLLDALDLDKGERRSFAILDIVEFCMPGTC
jgi:predicted DNA-binding transcriptional regulator YafY